MNCLNCKHWNRLFENPDIGTCEAVDVPLNEAYRFQFEECSQFEQGEAREPYLHLTWRSEKRSRFWIARKLGVSETAVATAERRYAEKGAK